MPEFYVTPNTINEIVACLKKTTPDAFGLSLQESNCVLQREFQLLRNKPFKYGKKINWHRDPVSKRKWRMWRNRPVLLTLGKYKDIKYVWELNRHQHLFSLAKAFLFTNKQQYRQEIYEQILAWIADNSTGPNINSNSGLEISLRIISWIWAIALVSDSDYSPNSWDQRILSSIHEQTEYIANNLQRREFSNNHLIGEASGLAIVGILFPNFPEAGDWKRTGVKILEEQILAQVFDDGMDKEQALDYHRFVLDFFTHVFILCQKNNVAISAEFSTLLEKMYEVLLYASGPKGMLPAIGDDDNGRVAKLTQKPGRFIFSGLSTGAVLFNRSDMKWICKKFYEESLWLLGVEGLKKFQALKSCAPKKDSFSFPRSGQHVMRSGWEQESCYLYFDCGPQGMGKSGHGHADALSIELSAYGTPLIVDSGTYVYNGLPQWRNYFRGTSAHNTVVIDGQDQAECLNLKDPFGWKKKADGHNLAWYSSKHCDFVSGYHEGYQGLSNPVEHQRDIFFLKPEYWVVVDFVYGKGNHAADLLFHFPPGEVYLDKNTKAFRTCYKNGANIEVLPAMAQALDVRVLSGKLKPVQGWVSANYGDKTQAPVLQYSKVAQVPFAFATVLYPFKQTRKAIIVNELEVTVEGLSAKAAQVSCLEVKIDGVYDYILTSRSEASAKVFKEFKTDAKTVCIRQDTNGRISSIFLRNGSYLLKQGCPLLRLEKSVLAFQVQIMDRSADIYLSEDVGLELNLEGVESTKVGILSKDDCR